MYICLVGRWKSFVLEDNMLIIISLNINVLRIKGLFILLILKWMYLWGLIVKLDNFFIRCLCDKGLLIGMVIVFFFCDVVCL